MKQISCILIFISSVLLTACGSTPNRFLDIAPTAQSQPGGVPFVEIPYSGITWTKDGSHGDCNSGDCGQNTHDQSYNNRRPAFLHAGRGENNSGPLISKGYSEDGQIIFILPSEYGRYVGQRLIFKHVFTATDGGKKNVGYFHISCGDDPTITCPEIQVSQ